MAEESTTPDLVELTRQSAEALDRGDLDATMSCYAPDVVFNLSEVGLGTFEGLEAIRGFFEDWRGSFDEISADFEEVLGFGHGVVLTVWSEQGRPRGSDGRVEQRRAMVTTWVGGRIQQFKAYADPTRPVLPPNASRRSGPMAEEGATPDLVELVRGSIEADSFDEWATLAEQLYTPDAVWDVGGMLGSLEGFAAIRAFVKDYWLMRDEHHHHVEEIVDLGNGVWFTVIREHGCIKGSNAVVEARNASVSLLADGRIVRAKTYTDVDKARAGAERLAQERG